jgi:hypothetical protein
MPSILIKRGTRAQLNAAATSNGLNAGELYFIADEAKLAVGVSVSTYTDIAKPQQSITSDASGLKLVGDTATPGPLMDYGTDASGTKGWYARPAGGGGGGASLALSSTVFATSPVAIKIALAVAAISGSVRLVRWRDGVSYEMLVDADYKLPTTQSVQFKSGPLATDTYLLQYFAAQTDTPAASAFSALSSTVAWNPADKGASIVLSGNNTVAGQVTSRCSVRANQAITTPSYWETVYFFAANGGTDLSAGIALAAMALTEWLGQTTNSVSGPYASSGNFYYGGANQGFLAAPGIGQRLGHAYNPSTGTYKITFNGTTWLTLKTGLTGTFYPAGTINYASQSLMLVCNPSDMWWSPPAGHNAGVS